MLPADERTDAPDGGLWGLLYRKALGLPAVVQDASSFASVGGSPQNPQGGGGRSSPNESEEVFAERIEQSLLQRAALLPAAVAGDAAAVKKEEKTTGSAEKKAPAASTVKAGEKSEPTNAAAVKAAAAAVKAAAAAEKAAKAAVKAMPPAYSIAGIKKFLLSQESLCGSFGVSRVVEIENKYADGKPLPKPKKVAVVKKANATASEKRVTKKSARAAA